MAVYSGKWGKGQIEKEFFPLITKMSIKITEVFEMSG